MKKTEDLREIELNAILKFSNDNIVITDGDGMVLRANPNCLSIYGKEASSIIGKSVERLEKEGIFSPSVNREPILADREPKLADREPKLADREPKLADRGPKLADREPKLADREPKLADRGPKLADKGPILRIELRVGLHIYINAKKHLKGCFFVRRMVMISSSVLRPGILASNTSCSYLKW
ncbi:hypothetical protein [Fictibacillus gelatini]|uniref:hypothetical protein n=1 Tax=Fictibacillus gelatini TaxID=225985 RepID=UPI0005598F6E